MTSLPLRARRWLAPALVATLVTAVGCDGGDEQPKVESRDLAKDELDARCEYLARCGFMPDEATCKDVERPDQALVQALGGSVFGRVDFNPAAAAAWIETLRELSCIATNEVAQELASARIEVFGGTIKTGGSCFADDECVEGNVCDRTACSGQQLCCTGSCVEFEILAERAACPLPQDGARLTGRCDDITWCQPPPVEEGNEDQPPETQGTCVLKVENGLPCEASQACADGQRCDTQDSGTCFKLSPHDAACNPMLAANPCLEINDACDPGSSTCQIAPGPGEPCPQGRCAGWASCRGDDTENPDTCIPFARRGESCESIPCLGDLVCRDGLCADVTTSHICVEGDPPPPPEMDGG
ncbi:MAG: hypothetical protein JKY37_12150 [Nannocystaceae bacterium]|nr:hypothetical protein [Nannocystaceae bacterium]